MTRTATIQELMRQSGVGFGTSGARGLVTAMTDAVCSAYSQGFLRALERRGEIETGSFVGIAGDLRPSTGRIMTAAAHGVMAAGYRVLHAGRVPSPALALLGIERRIPTMMVTGSHIPDDRNGIKFNKTTGEILKSDEQAILAEIVALSDDCDASGCLLEGRAVELPRAESSIREQYVSRWIDAFPRDLLKSKRVVVYGHSAVGRELVVEILKALGAEVIEVAWSEQFIPVDTEAIRSEDVALAAEWAKEYRPFSIVSTDGDSDRPLVSDEYGKWLRGDVLGVLCARFLKADAVVTPVSSSTVVERSRAFECVARTRIGSPYVIARMQELAEQGYGRVVGYEANGGFLTATPLEVPGAGKLSPLATRDAVIVMLGVLGAAVQSGRSVGDLERDLPERATASGRIQNFPSDVSAAKLKELAAGGVGSLDALLGQVAGKFSQIDLTDGVRGTTLADEILHLRASGNAPELRCYAEASSPTRSALLVEQSLEMIRQRWS